jgi:hypothetical protein
MPNDACFERSRGLFGGARYRLEIGAAIADGDGVVCNKELAVDLGDPPGTSSVGTELKILERAGLLTRLPGEKGERHVCLMPRPSSYSVCCQEFVPTCSGRGRSVDRQPRRRGNKLSPAGTPGLSRRILLGKSGGWTDSRRGRRSMRGNLEAACSTETSRNRRPSRGVRIARPVRYASDSLAPDPLLVPRSKVRILHGPFAKTSANDQRRRMAERTE